MCTRRVAGTLSILSFILLKPVSTIGELVRNLLEKLALRQCWNNGIDLKELGGHRVRCRNV